MPSPASLRPGDRVALLVPGSRDYLDLVIALLAGGVFPIPLDPRLTATERAGVLDDLAPTLAITDPADVPRLLAQLPAPARHGVPLGRPIHVTSGTTGHPKGVFSGLLKPDQAAALVTEERALWGFTADDVNLVLSPLYHSAPLRFATGTLLAGGRVVGFAEDGLQAPFDPVTATRLIETERPTTMFCVPAHLQRLFAHWDRVGVPDLSSFRLVAHAGAPCPPAIKRRLIELFPPETTWEFYGSTEGQFTACRSEEWQQRPGSVGRARPGRRLLVEDDGTIWCVVPDAARFSYFGAPEKTAQAWRDTPQGPAFTVGDLGHLDDDGYLYLSGRREDLIITGGVNVYPVEVENVLSAVPGVLDIAVHSVPSDEWGQQVIATVVGDVDEDALRSYAREHLAPPKRPKEYRFVEALPRTLTGKVLRRQL
ncbi:AMP-binding protein [Nocardioides dubius]|uniref:Acyl-CoA synthetase n=1 Tax=Nocardioides dubius TaxID=317019 RepID=A0ABP4EAM1_9ACTN